MLEPFNAVATIEEVSTTDNTSTSVSTHNYRLEIVENSDHLALCGEIANLIVNAGEMLYSINQEHRDLETLFREVNDTPVQESQKETQDAA